MLPEGRGLSFSLSQRTVSSFGGVIIAFVPPRTGCRECTERKVFLVATWSPQEGSLFKSTGPLPILNVLPHRPIICSQGF